MVSICFAVYVLVNNTRVVPKYGTTRVLFASTYTAKQMATMYYSLNIAEIENDYFNIVPVTGYNCPSGSITSMPSEWWSETYVTDLPSHAQYEMFVMWPVTDAVNVCLLICHGLSIYASCSTFLYVSTKRWSTLAVTGLIFKVYVLITFGFVYRNGDFDI